MSMPRLLSLFMAVLLLLSASAIAEIDRPLVVGSKSFTESVILGEVLRLTLASTGRKATHHAQLGGSRILFSALQAGEIDLYPEYTGTLMHELLASEQPANMVELQAALARRGLALLEPLGFNNGYAIGMTEARAAELDIYRISDLTRHPGLTLGMSHEFVDRADGWPGLRQRYALSDLDARGLDHDLAYRALASGQIDASDIYTTDAEIAHYGLRTLVDDLGYFREYRAVVLYRIELEQSAPTALERLRSLSGSIDEAAMITMNGRVKLSGEAEQAVAADFLRGTLSVDATSITPSAGDELLQRTIEHLRLVQHAQRFALELHSETHS